MTEETADRYLLHYADKLKGEDLPVLRAALIAAPEYKRKALLGVKLYNPLLTLVFSLVFGMLAVDRFYIKDIGKGILKVLSLAALSILTILYRIYATQLIYRENFSGFFSFTGALILFAIIFYAITFIELFLCYRKTKKKNLEKLLAALR